MKLIKKLLKKIYPMLYWKLLFCKYKIKKNKINKMNIGEKKEYLNKLYRKVFNRDIDWNNPNKYSEKIQYQKLYGKNNKEKAQLTDKYLVREWICKKIGEKYLIPLIGVYDEFSDIDFDTLPNSFVIKCNHDSASVTVVKNKNAIDWKKLKYKYDYHMQTDFSFFSLEEHYTLIQPKIIIEKYLETYVGNICDYKFLCFNGEPYYCWVDSNRFNGHSRNLYDLDWNLLDWNINTYKNSCDKIEKPQGFEKMLEIAKKLSKGFPHVRVDLYNIEGKIYFGEMTFSSGSGLIYIDEQHDLMLGNLWK